MFAVTEGVSLLFLGCSLWSSLAAICDVLIKLVVESLAFVFNSITGYFLTDFVYLMDILILAIVEHTCLLEKCLLEIFLKQPTRGDLNKGILKASLNPGV